MLYILISIVLLFLWVCTIPILTILCLLGIPFAFLMVCGGIVQSMIIKYERTSAIRRLLTSLPFEKWFYHIDSVNVPDKVLVTCHPHGVFCLGPLLGIHLQPQATTWFAVAPILFYIPLFGYIISKIGCIPATHYHISQALKTSSVILVPGGTPEIVLHEVKEYYTRRYGMFKFQVPLLPVISSTHYTLWPMPARTWRVQVARHNIPIVFPWLFGWYSTCLPKRKPIHLRVKDVFHPSGSLEDNRKRYYENLID